MGYICDENMESTLSHSYVFMSGNECDHTRSNFTLQNMSTLSSEKIFIKPEPFVYYSIGSLLTCVMIVGFTANFSVLYAYAKVRQIRTTDNTMIIGLAISDFGQSILGIPFVVIACFSRRWIFGHNLCQFYAFVTTFLGLSQITTLTLIATERYFIIVQHNRKMSDTQRKGATVMVCSFLYGSFWATGPLLGWSNYKEEDIGIACCVTWEVNNSSALSYTISLCTIGWLLPLTLIAYGYISIALSIRKEQAKRQYMHSVSSLNKNKRRERKVAITVLIMIGAFVISWMPYSVVSLWSAFGDFHNIPLGVQVAPAIFAKCSIIWNPMIYVARHKHFRRGVKHSVPCLYMLSRSKSQVSETRQLEQATNAQRQGSSVRENSQSKHSDCFRSSSYSSETPSMNKESIACSNHGTYSVWVETPTSLQHGKETNFFPHKNFRQSTDTDAACYEGLISETNHFITLGTQTDSSYLATVQINHRLKSEHLGESKDVADKSDIDAQKVTALEHNGDTFLPVIISSKACDKIPWKRHNSAKVKLSDINQVYSVHSEGVGRESTEALSGKRLAQNDLNSGSDISSSIRLPRVRCRPSKRKDYKDGRTRNIYKTDKYQRRYRLVSEPTTYRRNSNIELLHVMHAKTDSLVPDNVDDNDMPHLIRQTTL